MDWSERIANYERVTGMPRSLFIAGDGRVVGTWIMGQNYRVKSGYYGGYPHGYLRRVKALFPDKIQALHLFSGKVDLVTWPGTSIDVNEEHGPTWVDDAQTLEAVPDHAFTGPCGADIVLADPPYSVEDCEHYGVGMIKRNKVMDALARRCRSGTHIVWLDQVLPMYRKVDFALEAVIGMVKSTNHRFRVVTVFRRR